VPVRCNRYNVTYLRIGALRPPRANMPAQREQRTNAFGASRGDKMVMRPVVRLLSRLVQSWHKN